jgi:hypothetical protein
VWDIATSRRELLFATLHRHVGDGASMDTDSSSISSSNVRSPAASFPELVLRTRVDNALGAALRATEHDATHALGDERLRSARQWVQAYHGDSLGISFAINRCATDCLPCVKSLHTACAARSRTLHYSCQTMLPLQSCTHEHTHARVRAPAQTHSLSHSHVHVRTHTPQLHHSCEAEESGQGQGCTRPIVTHTTDCSTRNVSHATHPLTASALC